jgi:hypothetical protein
MKPERIAKLMEDYIRDIQKVGAEEADAADAPFVGSICLDLTKKP